MDCWYGYSNDVEQSQATYWQDCRGMAESGIDLSYDDAFMKKTTSVMANQSSSSLGSQASSMPSTQRIYRRPLRANQRLALAKQQAEQMQQGQRNPVDNKSKVTIGGSSNIRPLPVIQAESMAITGEDVDVSNENQTVIDITGRTAPSGISFGSMPHNSHLWSSSAPDVLSLEIIQPPGSAATSYSEIDEQLNDIVSSIDNELGTPGSYVSESSFQEGSYRGGRKKELPPPDMTPEQQVMWEMSRRKKDAHNDIEKRRRYKINECIQELGTMLPECYDSIYKEPANSKGAILQATVEYIRQLQSDQKQMKELQSRVEQLEQSQRKLILEREALRALWNNKTTEMHPAPVTAQIVTPITVALPMSHVINTDCYMPPADSDEVGMDLATLNYDDILMTDHQDFLDLI